MNLETAAPTPGRQFQLRLLSRMSAQGHVAAALQRLGVGRPEMAAAVQAMAAFDAPVRWAADYPRVLGPAAEQRWLPAAEAAGAFAGSLQHRWRLPLWPAVAYAVNEAPDGWAWGDSFVATQRVPWRGPPQAIEPWQATRDQLAGVARWQVIDEWSWDIEALLHFDDGAVFEARFDHGLLQRWTPRR